MLTHSAPKGSLITNVPGFNGSLPSKHYGGYVTIDESHGKNLYYYFVQSEGDSSKDPIVLWLNGGPGCSSFDGFVYEHGNNYFSLSFSFCNCFSNQINVEWKFILISKTIFLL